MASSRDETVKAAITDLASTYGMEVVGFLKLDQSVTIPEDEMELLRGVKWSDGEVDIHKVPDPLDLLPEAKTMIILGKRLIDDRKDVYYKVSEDYTASVETMLLDIAVLRILSLLEDRDLKAAEYTSYYLKVWAVLAGFGWIGKSRMFVSSDHGPRLRLKAILTDADLGQLPIREYHYRCADCQECVEACPAGAIGETGVDRKKCGSCRLNHRKAGENAYSYCTMCTVVCPVGKVNPDG